MDELRTVLKENSNGEWIKVRMKDLEINDRVCMFEPDGTPVMVNSSGIFIVRSTPYLTGDVWTVDVDYT